MKSKSVPIAFQLARLPVFSSLFKYVTPRSIIEKSIHNVYVHDERITDKLIDRYYDLALREGNRKAFIERMKVSITSDKYLKRLLKKGNLANRKAIGTDLDFIG